MKLKSLLVYGSTIGLWIFVIILWVKGFSSPVVEGSPSDGMMKHKVEQAHDIQVQAALRIKELEDKVASLEQQLADFFEPEDGMSSRDTSAMMKKKINDAYDKCPYAQGNPPSIPSPTPCRCPDNPPG